MQDAERRIAAEAGRDEVEAAAASAEPEPEPKTAAPASSTGYRTRWAGVRELPQIGPTAQEQERMAARMRDTSDELDYLDSLGEEPQA